MSNATTQTPFTAETLLAAVRQLPPPEFSEFARGFQEWHRQRPGTEDDVLLARIDQHSQLPSGKQQRYEALRTKCENRTLSPHELAEYQALLQELEAANVKRVEALVALAERRGVALPALVAALNRSRDTKDS